MFEKVRKPSRAKGIVAYLIFGAIILVFIGFGVVPDRTSQTATGVAAIVNHSQISLADFRDRVEMMEKQYQLRLDQIPQEQRQQMNQLLRQRALEDLVEYEVMAQAASQRGLRVSDEEIRDFIVQIPSFQEQGRFKRDLYNRFLQIRQFSASQFEDKIRKDLLIRKLQILFQQAFRISHLEQELDQLVGSTRFNFAVASFADQELSRKLTVANQEMTQYLGDQKHSSEVQKYYESHKDQYTEPEKVKARHILIKVDKAQVGSSEAAEKKIKEIAEKAKTVDFGSLARTWSEDIASKSQGGDLGYFSKGQKVAEFENVAFNTPVGKISAPFKTDFGYHLIKVEDHKPSYVKSLDQVKNEIAKSQIAESKIAGFINSFQTHVAQGDESFVKKQLKELKVDLVDTGEVNLEASQIPKVGEAEPIFSAVLSKGIQKGLVPELVKTGGRHYVVFVKSFSQKTSPAMKRLPLDGGRGEVSSAEIPAKYSDAFRLWAHQVTSQASIKRNEQLWAN